MRVLPVTFWIWLGHIHAHDEQHVADIPELENITDIRRIPLYANLKEIGIDPDVNDVYTMEGDGIPPLPVGLDFQLLSVNGGM